LEQIMAIEIRRFQTVDQLGEVALPFLMRQEAHHNLILGFIGRLERQSNPGDSQPYLAAAVSHGAVVAAAAMMPPSPLILSLCDEPDALTELARDVHDFSLGTAAVSAPLPFAPRFAQAWEHLTGEPTRVAMTETCYRLERVRPPSGVGGKARLATEADMQLLTEWQIAFGREATPWERFDIDSVRRGVERRLAQPPEIAGTFIWEDGGRAACMVAYGSPTPNSLRIAPVYTPPEHRRRGYGSACTAAVCQLILDSGKRFVTLFADQANPTSNHIYRTIGFEPVCDAELIRFGGR
jgi:predicted GNAT family acetyltransferase